LKTSTSDDKSYLRSFSSHGLDFQPASGDQVRADCPFCDDEGQHFHMNVLTGLWDCLTGDTPVLTREGYAPISSLNGKEVELLSHMGWIKAKVQSGGVQPVFALQMTRDRRHKTVRATARHRWIVRGERNRLTEVLTKDLLPGCRLAYTVAPRPTAPHIEGIRHGIMFGDGERVSNTVSGGRVELCGPKIDLAKYLYGNLAEREDTDGGVPRVLVHGQRDVYKELPTFADSDSYLLGFILGYFATDGTAFGETSITSKRQDAMEFVRQAAARVGLAVSPVSAYWVKSTLGGKTYEGYQYRLCFHRSTLYPDFFLREDHRESVVSRGAYGGDKRLSWRIENIVPAGEEEVFCAVVPGVETFCLDDNLLTGNCKRCMEEGNLVVFFRGLWERLREHDYSFSDLARDRKLLAPKTCEKWGVVEGLPGYWTVPGFNVDLNVVQLYRFMQLSDQPKARLYPTYIPDGEAQGLFKVADSQLTARKVIICEGLWDAMCLSEVVDRAKYDVVGVPGCNIFKNSWTPLFSGKDVTIIYHNDHPQGNGGTPAALKGIQRAVSILASSKKPPKSISYLRWGDKEDYWTEGLKHGYDLRDHLSAAATLYTRQRLWGQLSKNIVLVPEDWKVPDQTGRIILPDRCTSLSDLRGYWQAAMSWPAPGEELDYGLCIVMACAFSTATQGDPIWLRLIAPPGSGKSVLCEALTTSKRYVKAISELNSLASGFKTRDGDDKGLIAQLEGKTLMIKDGNTLQENRRKEQIMAELRDAYDGSFRTHYGNGMGKDYEGLRFTLVVGSTTASKVDRSELGERMLDCIMSEGIEMDRERDINDTVCDRAWDEARTLVNGEVQSRIKPELLAARMKTGGFLEYLRDDAASKLMDLTFDRDRRRTVKLWAEFAAFMRTQRPLDKGRGHAKIEVERELSSRLVSQFTRLAASLTIVLGRDSVDDEVMSLVRQVALDTSRGESLNALLCLYRNGTADYLRVSRDLEIEHEDTYKLLSFLRKMGIAEKADKLRGIAANTPQLWRLTERVRSLYDNIL
jgi:hypothetical protein